MKNKINPLIKKYEEELESVLEEDCNNCCDYASCGERRYLIEKILTDLYSLVQ